MSYTVRLDHFEGPLDLLLHLIEKAEVDIHNIPITQITDQYMVYIQAMKELQLDVASEFLVMAATLLSIKSSMLLPQMEPEPWEWQFDEDMEEALDPRQLLIERLVEYKKFKLLAQELQNIEGKQQLIFTKPPHDLSPFRTERIHNPLEGISVYHLVDAFQKALAQAEAEEPSAHIPRDEVSIKKRISEVYQFLITAKTDVSFVELLGPYRSRTELIITFLAVLELIKKSVVTFYQGRLFDDIRIRLTQPIE